MLLFSIFYKNGKYAVRFIIFYLIIFIFGSSFNSLLLYFMGLTNNLNIKSIVYGVPDIEDLLYFWNCFITKNYEFSYGKTIYGGLIPYHYKWNISVVTKLVIGASANAPSGGYRLPVQVEGYIAFGIFGTIVWSIVYGLINGIHLRLTKFAISQIKDNFLKLYISIFLIELFNMLLNFFINMQIDVLFSIFIYYFIIFVVVKLKLKYNSTKSLKKVY
ncbi:MAG: hypothetical protein C0173_08785 [Desulfurella sp.]|nr:MAG: hypothetical protein C0173_08785 [Desulfurella sp.]